MYTRLKELYKNPTEYLSKEVTLGGWIRTLRDNKGVGFIQLYDGSFFKPVQVVIDAENLNTADNALSFEKAVKLGAGACITVVGEVVESPGAGQSFEIRAKSIALEGDSPSDYVLQKKRHSLEFLRTIAHLRPRTNTFAAVFRVRSVLYHAIHNFFANEGFVYIHTPILTGNDCEGAGEMFRVTTLPMEKVPQTPDGKPDYAQDFFSRQAYLTVSGQVAVEPFIMAFRDVYTFGPTFRSENSQTTTHAAEFWMLEPEMAFADLNTYLETAESLLKYVINDLFDKAPEEMAFFDEWIEKGIIDRIKAVSTATFARCTYTEAVEILQKSGKKFDYPVSWGANLQTEHERYLCEEVFKGPTFVTDYPMEIKAFYMRLNDDGKTVAAADLLVPGVGELIGGSQREERMDMLAKSLERNNLSPEEYDWYMDLRRYGSVKHAGFGLGFERLLMYLTGMKNIRDVIPYPRTSGQMAF